MTTRPENIVSTPIPAATLDALIDVIIEQSGSDTLDAHEISDLLMAALALRTARRTGKQVFFLI